MARGGEDMAADGIGAMLRHKRVLAASLIGTAVGAGVAAVLRRLAVPPWLIAAVSAPPLAWVAATTLPLA